MIDSLPISVVVPTYQREQVLLETIEHLLALRPAAAEILVVDQTETHQLPTEQHLARWAASSRIRWLRLDAACITAAMNEGLRRANQEIVLFLDDDIRPEPDLLAAHVSAHRDHGDGLVAGRVIQPWQEGLDEADDRPFHFASRHPAQIREFMGGNFSIRKGLAIGLGGFDENFVRVAYRFEAEFADRWIRSGRRIYFEPAACLHHLKVAHGGTRSYGDHLSTWRPDHAVGAYYYALRTGAWRDFLARPLRAIATRHHLRHPLSIPATLLAEAGGMMWAIGLFLRGPKRLQPMAEQAGR